MKTDVISSWKKNASEWIKVMQENSIASRQFTNQAIVEEIDSTNCKKLVDVGCGEGWLARHMGSKGISVVGVDAIEDLILEAKNKGQEQYHVFTFEDIIEGKQIPGAPFDCAVFNFCLYNKEGLSTLLGHTLDQLQTQGIVLIQTLHPFFLLQNGMPYTSQWLSDSWKGLPGNFEDGHAWYARTFEDWMEVLSHLKNVTYTVKEVLNNEKKPVSLILKIQKQL